VNSPTQRSLPDNTQHSKETDIHAPAGFEPTIPASERPQTHALDRVAIELVVITLKHRNNEESDEQLHLESPRKCFKFLH
jgi:hypothetical protein